MPTKTNAAALAGDYGVKSGEAKYTNEPVERLLSRLERVRKAGRGWTAKCPAHEDRTASMSITAGDDGRFLRHCFAGCSAADIVAALGMEIGDLFVKKPTKDMSFAERSALREHGRQARWRAALNAMGLETKIVVIAGRQIKKQEPLNEDDERRLDEALERIDSAREVLNAQRN
jgi:DNA primase